MSCSIITKPLLNVYMYILRLLFAEKAQAYRPPQARGTSASIKLHEYEGPSDPNKKVSQGKIHFLLNSLKYKFILHVPFK